MEFIATCSCTIWASNSPTPTLIPFSPAIPHEPKVCRSRFAPALTEAPPRSVSGERRRSGAFVTPALSCMMDEPLRLPRPSPCTPEKGARTRRAQNGYAELAQRRKQQIEAFLSSLTPPSEDH